MDKKFTQSSQWTRELDYYLYFMTDMKEVELQLEDTLEPQTLDDTSLSEISTLFE